MEERKNVYLSLHKSFVREGIEYTDRATGEARTFNPATLPKGTVVDGVDVGGYEFSPMFVNESRFKGADFRDIPLLANREVWLRKTVMGPDGQPELDEDGRTVKDTVKVMPAQLKEAVDAGRSRYLAERADHARQASRAAEHDAPRAGKLLQRALHGGVRLHGAQTCADDLVSGIAKRHKICPFRSKAFCRQCIT